MPEQSVSIVHMTTWAREASKRTRQARINKQKGLRLGKEKSGLFYGPRLESNSIGGHIRGRTFRDQVPIDHQWSEGSTVEKVQMRTIFKYSLIGPMESNWGR